MGDQDEAAVKAASEGLVSRFIFGRLLNQDQGGRRVTMLGRIDENPALLVAERAAFSNDISDLEKFAQSLRSIQNLGANDIYNWYLASTDSTTSPNHEDSTKQPPDLKINLIYPCSEQHIVKYSSQGMRVVTETPEVYRDFIHPHMKKNREEGRLNWVFNIIEGRKEQAQIMFRQLDDESNKETNEGFLILPDLNWDRKTISTLHLLGIVERRDIWSVRDLCKKHVTWLKHMQQKLLDATIKLYPQLEEDQLKMYIHYQPTYYHFHIHVVNAMLEAGPTQAVGKALSLSNVISQLESMTNQEDGMKDVSLTYNVGEASELWTDIFEPLKRESLKRKRGEE